VGAAQLRFFRPLSPPAHAGLTLTPPPSHPHSICFQVTTWNPTPPGATSIPGGPIDYASKHWSGLISGYYASRAATAQRMALAAAAAGASWDPVAWDLAKATHATEFQLSTTPLPTAAVGDFVAVSQATIAKYEHWFASC
jgi:hypothetical protein